MKHDRRAPLSGEDVLLAVLQVLLFLVLFAAAVLVATATAYADEDANAWVLCQPDSYVHIRSRANKHAQSIGYALCGDDFETDGTVRNGFVHLVNAPTESGEGWIAKGYVVFDQPEQVDHAASIEAAGRVACRSVMGGSRRRWVRPGDTVTVYWMSPEWSVTSAGFIMTRYIGAVDVD